MSCTVTFVPFLLISVVSALVEGVAANNYSRGELRKQFPKIDNYINNYEQNIQQNIPVEHFVEKDFETVFMDKTLLLKTLEEHGVANIVEDGNNISGEIENFVLAFSKSSDSSPYSLHILCKETDNAQEKVDDLNSEYTLNVQEETYLNLISKLKDSNMQVESEEVLDDNTIVLTVNLE